MFLTTGYSRDMNYKVPLLLAVISASLYYFLWPAPPLSDEQLTAHLKNKVVLICGASSGIGEELAYQLGGHGSKLALIARSQDKLQRVKEELMQRGTPAENVFIFPFDFSNVTGSKDVVDKTLREFGALDYLVSNHAAWITDPFLAVPYLQNPDYIDMIFRVNLFSHIQLAVHALPHLEKRRGHMYFSSSVAGEVPSYRSAIHCSTKYAMNGFFYSLQQELLARESPVSLTIGAIGLIWTKELSQILASVNPPDWSKGSVEECARGMAESYVTRPQTMTYPWLAGVLYRGLWHFRAHFHENMIQKLKPKGAEGTGYREVVDKVVKKAKLFRKLQYQQGYGEEWKAAKDKKNDV
jgi:short-subunit dehydrogenase